MTVRASLCGLSVFAFVVAGVLPASAQAVDFGDDSSIWAMDGECDDPRFIGDGMAADPQEADILADASDCSAAFNAGTVTLDPAMADAQVPVAPPGKPGSEPMPVSGDIDFGADTSPWANDGECDDPRFVGQGMAAQPQESDVMADASDCRALYEAGSIDFLSIPDHSEDMAGGDVDFGDDSSPWAMDGECDDPRFMGDGMAAQPQDSDIFADATDCRTLYDAGMIMLINDGDSVPLVDAGVDFGDDSSPWAMDGECDDPRFMGDGMAAQPQDSDIFADATDCRTLYDAGMIMLINDGDSAPVVDGEVDFGADSGQWINDGECDDPRFAGEGMAAVLLDEDRFADASDCRALYDAGMIFYIGD